MISQLISYLQICCKLPVALQWQNTIIPTNICGLSRQKCFTMKWLDKIGSTVEYYIDSTSADDKVRSSELGGMWLMPPGTGGGGASGILAPSFTKVTADGVGAWRGGCPLEPLDSGLGCVCSRGVPSRDPAVL